ncbi:hypothetical protein BGZ54_007358 [Gamsiella multidivaricata]|nr:hypothetical protein BGZ54_007358 [Gamsiella multidivaricata]
MNRINAIVAPRNPHPLKLSVRFALKLPAFYLLMKSAVVTLALLLQDQPTMPLAWLMSDIRISYDESHALWLSFIAMGVSCTVDSFIANLHFTGTSEQTISMLEWAILFHFTPFGNDILIISAIQVCQLLTLQFLSLSSRGKNYRLMATTFWGMLDLLHFAHAVYHRSGTYPSLQLLTRLPEVVVLLMICISMILHALTYIVTGGNVRRQMFEPRAMPTMDEDYGLAVFKLGRACMEATRGAGFRNEVDAVVLPFGTTLDRKQTSKSRSSLRSPFGRHSHSQQNAQETSFSFPNGSTHRHGPALSGFANEMADVVEMPGQRQLTSRRRNRMNVMKAFCQSSASLIMETTYAAYNKAVPARFRQALRRSRGPNVGTRMSMQEYLQLRTNLETALERARQLRELKLHEYEVERYRQAAALDEEEEEELYSEFLSRDLTASDDEDEIYDVDYMQIDDTEEEDEEDSDSDMEVLKQAGSTHEDALQDSEAYGMSRRHRDHSDSDEDSAIEVDYTTSQQVSTWRSIGCRTRL